MTRVAAPAVREALRGGAMTLDTVCLVCPGTHRHDVARALARMVKSGAVMQTHGESRLAPWAAVEAEYLAAAQARRGAYRAEPSPMDRAAQNTAMRVCQVLRGWRVKWPLAAADRPGSNDWVRGGTLAWVGQ